MPQATDCAMSDADLCPLCGAREAETYLESKGKTLSSEALGSSRIEVSCSRIVRCRNCEFGFLQERPSESELAQLYQRLESSVYEAQAKGRQATARRHLKLLNWHARCGELLDVGCASGAFLAAAVENGWSATGIEPAKELCDKANNKLAGRAKIYCTTLQDAHLEPASFDAVTLWDVLEHVPDPGRFMRQCAALLKPGGHLLLNVPNLDSIQARFMGPRWPLFLPEHLNYFNHKSLRLCGTQAGLQWVHFGQRPALFSVEYVLYRLRQHRVPGASLGYSIFSKSPFGAIRVPVYLGETFGVWQRS